MQLQDCQNTVVNTNSVVVKRKTSPNKKVVYIVCTRTFKRAVSFLSLSLSIDCLTSIDFQANIYIKRMGLYPSGLICISPYGQYKYVNTEKKEDIFFFFALTLSFSSFYYK